MERLQSQFMEGAAATGVFSRRVFIIGGKPRIRKQFVCILWGAAWSLLQPRAYSNTPTCTPYKGLYFSVRTSCTSVPQICISGREILQNVKTTCVRRGLRCNILFMFFHESVRASVHAVWRTIIIAWRNGTKCTRVYAQVSLHKSILVLVTIYKARNPFSNTAKTLL